MPFVIHQNRVALLERIQSTEALAAVCMKWWGQGWYSRKAWYGCGGEPDEINLEKPHRPMGLLEGAREHRKTLDMEIGDYMDCVVTTPYGIADALNYFMEGWKAAGPIVRGKRTSLPGF
jgi:hypothetical protein